MKVISRIAAIFIFRNDYLTLRFSLSLSLPFPNGILQVLVILSVGIVCAEPPSSYLPPSSSYGTPSFGGGGSGGGSLLTSGSGGGYTAINSGYQESEGSFLDQGLLHKIEEILLDQENQASSHGGHGHGGHSHGGHSGPQSSYGPPSSGYLPPSSSYGVPSASAPRVVGVHLGNFQRFFPNF